MQSIVLYTVNDFNTSTPFIPTIDSTTPRFFTPCLNNSSQECPHNSYDVSIFQSTTPGESGDCSSLPNSLRMPLGQWSGHIWADLDLVPSRSPTPTPQAFSGKNNNVRFDDLLVLSIRWLVLIICWLVWFGFDFSFGFVFFPWGLL